MGQADGSASTRLARGFLCSGGFLGWAKRRGHGKGEGKSAMLGAVPPA